MAALPPQMAALPQQTGADSLSNGGSRAVCSLARCALTRSLLNTNATPRERHKQPPQPQASTPQSNPKKTTIPHDTPPF
eukprot:2638833-Rhodomonas_salina.2